DLFLRLVAHFLVRAAIAPAERGIGALTHFVGGQRGDERETAARPLGRGLGGARRALRRCRGAGSAAAGAAAERARTFFFFGFELRTSTRRRADGGGRRCRRGRRRGL